MLKKDVIKHFGSQSKTARALRISNSAVSQWPEELTDSLQYKVELATNGVLKSSETKGNTYIKDGRFQVDKYLSNVSYKDFHNNNSGWLLHYVWAPSCLSPDGSHVYLRSVDLEFAITDHEFLLDIMEGNLKSIKEECNKKEKHNWSCRDLYLNEVDYLLISNILASQYALPEDYLFPEYYIAQAKGLRE